MKSLFWKGWRLKHNKNQALAIIQHSLSPFVSPRLLHFPAEPSLARFICCRVLSRKSRTVFIQTCLSHFLCGATIPYNEPANSEDIHPGKEIYALYAASLANWCSVIKKGNFILIYLELFFCWTGKWPRVLQVPRQPRLAQFQK